MMALRRIHTLLFFTFLWITVSSSAPGVHRLTARIRLRRDNGPFIRFNAPNGHIIPDLKLVHSHHDDQVYAGSPQSLYLLIQGEHPALKQIHVPMLEPECPSHSDKCDHTISVLKDGRKNYTLFMCGLITEEHAKCCDVDSEYHHVNCFIMTHSPTYFSEQALHVGDALYRTVSHDTGFPYSKGIFRWADNKFTWQHMRDTEQKYVKLIASPENGPLDRKVYAFYVDKNDTQDLVQPLWTSMVSQNCVADRGGSRVVLRDRWTSMLLARLYCGDEERGLLYSRLQDVAVLEEAEWNNTMIYGLFKNANNLTAMCVYKMSEIIRVFSTNELKEDPWFEYTVRPGQCVENSNTLPMSFLRFMQRHPEMTQWIKPAREPLLFNHNYIHLLLDRVESRKSGNSHVVFFMSLDNGKVHKVLDQGSEPFIITEYVLFNPRTPVTSMLLDRANKTLFVGSRTGVIQIDLKNCTVNGKSCDSCVMARDPYCGWGVTECLPAFEALLQDVTHGNATICGTDGLLSSASRTQSKRIPTNNVPQASKYYLQCPIESHHALYAWDHDGEKKECISTEQDCLLLINSMSEKDEGMYKCISLENGYEKIVRQELLLNAAPETRTIWGVALACLVFLIYLM